MVEARLLGVGKLVLHGEVMDFEPSVDEFRIRQGEKAELMVLYEYREASHEKDHTRIVVTAEIEGQKLGEEEREITDSRLLADDKRGFLSIPIRVAARGSLRGTWRAHVLYSRSPWEGGHGDAFEFEKEGTFTLHIA